MTEYKKKELNSEIENNQFTPTTKHTKQSLVWNISLILIICMGAVYIYIDSQKVATKNEIKSVNQDQQYIQITNKSECDDEPPQDKSYYILDNSIIGRSDTPYSKLKVSNDYGYHVVMEISSADKITPYALLSVHPKSQASISLPLGYYGLKLKAGSVWCNREVGFSDGEIINIANQIALQNEKTQEITITSKGPALRDIHLDLNNGNVGFKNQVSTNLIDGFGITEITQANYGNYYIA